ncbi:MAG: hypothetical protein M1837_001546 [Sclerophora amabilis]|nr:MAG: hypothetical protein M1837_001546 [Sclerophora amabilis]
MWSRSSVHVRDRPVSAVRKPQNPIHRLPHEISNCVMEQLKNIHMDPLLASCSTCYLRDLYSMALTSRSWNRAVRPTMYESIFLVGKDSFTHAKKKFKSQYGARLKLLRRTLRDDTEAARWVRELKVPEIPNSIPFGSAEYLKCIDVVASVVMCCPNLERLMGFYPSYNHEFDRLSYALSTRSKLKEQVWIISGDQTRHSNQSNSLVQTGLQPEQIETFLHYHANWSRLETLFLHADSKGNLDHELFVGVFSQLRSLKHLCVSNFDAADFEDSTLQAMPPLHSLRLEKLRGVTERGILQFASSPSASTLRRLSLIGLEITSLSALAKLFANLINLRRFTLVQESSPELPFGGLVLQPVIGSPSLEYLHWDVLMPGGANDNLASSMLADGFPSLRTLRAPSDFDGILQSVCKPVDQMCLPGDRFRINNRRRPSPTPVKQPNINLNHHPTAPYSPSSSNFSALSPTSPTYTSFSPTSPTFSTYTAPPSPPPSSCTSSFSIFPTSTTTSTTITSSSTIKNDHDDDANAYPSQRSLLDARLAAQSRLETARDHPWFTVIIEDASNSGSSSTTTNPSSSSTPRASMKPSLTLTPTNPPTSPTSLSFTFPTPPPPSSSPPPPPTTTIKQIHHFPSYLGLLNSSVRYTLTPDVRASDEAVIDLTDLLERARAQETDVRDGCTGTWNREDDHDHDRARGRTKTKAKAKECWWHTERDRERWRAVEQGYGGIGSEARRVGVLERFF